MVKRKNRIGRWALITLLYLGILSMLFSNRAFGTLIN